MIFGVAALLGVARCQFMCLLVLRELPLGPVSAGVCKESISALHGDGMKCEAITSPKEWCPTDS